MSKPLCFCIENKNVYLDQVLVDYEGIPVFFVCKEQRQFYLALCTDFDEFNYIVVEVTIKDVYELLHGMMPMRDVILKQKRFWEVKSADEIVDDVTIECSMTNINLEVLPEAGAYFKVLTNEIKDYVKAIDKMFFDRSSFESIPKKNSYLPMGGLLEDSLEFDNHIKKWEILKEICLDKTRDSAFYLDNVAGNLRIHYGSKMNKVKNGVIQGRITERREWKLGDYPYAS